MSASKTSTMKHGTSAAARLAGLGRRIASPGSRGLRCVAPPRRVRDGRDPPSARHSVLAPVPADDCAARSRLRSRDRATTSILAVSFRSGAAGQAATDDGRTSLPKPVRPGRAPEIPACRGCPLSRRAYQIDDGYRCSRVIGLGAQLFCPPGRHRRKARLSPWSFREGAQGEVVTEFECHDRRKLTWWRWPRRAPTAAGMRGVDQRPSAAPRQTTISSSVSGRADRPERRGRTMSSVDPNRTDRRSGTQGTDSANPTDADAWWRSMAPRPG